MRRLLTVLLAVGVCSACGSPQAVARPLQVRKAYLGLDCRHTFPCAHLGIAIWLRAPARRVTVELHGRRLTLARRGRYWQGFAHDERAKRIAADQERTLQLTVTAAGTDGVVRSTELASPVMGGWG